MVIKIVIVTVMINQVGEDGGSDHCGRDGDVQNDGGNDGLFRMIVVMMVLFRMMVVMMVLFRMMVLMMVLFRIMVGMMVLFRMMMMFRVMVVIGIKLGMVLILVIRRNRKVTLSTYMLL